MKTGNTGHLVELLHDRHRASMEPGHEDREYSSDSHPAAMRSLASMEPGHEDREYVSRYVVSAGDTLPQWSPVMKTGNTWKKYTPPMPTTCLNGARP